MKAKRDKWGRLQQKGEGSLMVWGFPKDLRRQFKVACAQKGSTMRQAVIDLVKGYVQGF